MKDFLLPLGDGGLGRLARHGQTTPGDWEDSRSRQFWRDRQLLGLSTTKSRSRAVDERLKKGEEPSTGESPMQCMRSEVPNAELEPKA